MLRKREGKGCPVTGALQLVGDKWTLLVVRELARDARRTKDLLENLYPISSRTLLARLREMERDKLIERRTRTASPPHVEYFLTNKGTALLPLLETLRQVGTRLDCGDCQERFELCGEFCASCPQVEHERKRTNANHQQDGFSVLW